MDNKRDEERKQRREAVVLKREERAVGRERGRDKERRASHCKVTTGKLLQHVALMFTRCIKFFAGINLFPSILEILETLIPTPAC